MIKNLAIKKIKNLLENFKNSKKIPEKHLAIQIFKIPLKKKNLGNTLGLTNLSTSLKLNYHHYPHL